jgi:PQQ-like domain
LTYIDLEHNEQPDSPFVLRWTGKVRSYINSSVCIASLIVFADWSGNLVALDEASGRKVWQAKAAAPILEPLFVFNNLVWVCDDKGIVAGYNPATGRCDSLYRLRFRGWGVQHYHEYICFLDRVTPNRYARNGRPSRLNLLTGEIDVYTDRLAHDWEGIKRTTYLLADDESVFFFVAPDLLKFSIREGRLLHSWHIPHCYWLTGLAAFEQTIVGVTELDISAGSQLGAARYLEYNRTPLLVITNDRVKGYPILVRGVFSYTSSVLKLAEQSYLVAIGENIFRFEHGDMVQSTSFPNQSIYGLRGAGLFQVANRFIAFQRQERVHAADEGYYLQVYQYDPIQAQLIALGAPLRTNAHGWHYKGASVDQYGEHFFLRGDRRYHYVSWKEA